VIRKLAIRWHERLDSVFNWHIYVIMERINNDRGENNRHSVLSYKKEAIKLSAFD
jgi:hypothetical protein